MTRIRERTRKLWRVCWRAVALAGVIAAAIALAHATATLGQEEPMPSPHHVAAAPHDPSGPDVRLPDRVGPFLRSGEPRTIEPAGIFEYMDGAGELYLAYRFDRLDVVEYTSPDQGDILVEIYRMGGSDDAYGLLSQDWGGEAVALREPPPAAGPRALYGAGLLRLWSNDLYARVMANRESTAAREAALSLGRAIAAGRPDTPPPRLVTALPVRPAPKWTLQAGGVCFLRSHLVLNSAYFVSQRDILDLGQRTEAALATYHGPRSGGVEARPRLLVVRYADSVSARDALAHFREAYLPEVEGTPPAHNIGSARVEDGWVGFSVSGRCLALVFAAPDRNTAESFVAAARATLESLEVSHE